MFRSQPHSAPVLASGHIVWEPLSKAVKSHSPVNPLKPSNLNAKKYLPVDWIIRIRFCSSTLNSASISLIIGRFTCKTTKSQLEHWPNNSPWADSESKTAEYSAMSTNGCPAQITGLFPMRLHFFCVISRNFTHPEFNFQSLHGSHVGRPKAYTAPIEYPSPLFASTFRIDGIYLFISHMHSINNQNIKNLHNSN